MVIYDERDKVMTIFHCDFYAITRGTESIAFAHLYELMNENACSEKLINVLWTVILLFLELTTGKWVLSCDRSVPYKWATNIQCYYLINLIKSGVCELYWYYRFTNVLIHVFRFTLANKKLKKEKRTWKPLFCRYLVIFSMYNCFQ